MTLQPRSAADGNDPDRLTWNSAYWNALTANLGAVAPEPGKRRLAVGLTTGRRPLRILHRL